MASGSRQGHVLSIRTNSDRCPPSDPGGDVQQAVAQRRGLGLGEVVVDRVGLGPGDRVHRGQDKLNPCRVDSELRRGQPLEAQVLGIADAVLNPSMWAVTGLQVRELSGFGVGVKGLKAPPVVVGEAELASGVWLCTAHDHSDPEGHPAAGEVPEHASAVARSGLGFLGG
jgi:hypothetical protein